MEPFGISREEGRCVALEWSDHSVFTTELSRYLPRRPKLFYDIDEVFRAHSEMYKAQGHPEWIDEMKTFLRQNRQRIKDVYEAGKVPSAKASDFPAIKERVFRFLDSL